MTLKCYVQNSVIIISSTIMLPYCKQWIMSGVLEGHAGKVSVGGRTFASLRFANDIDALAEEEQELEVLAESLDKTCRSYKLEISAENTILTINSVNGI